MKLLLLLAFISTGVLAQSEYDAGFEAGLEEGLEEGRKASVIEAGKELYSVKCSVKVNKENEDLLIPMIVQEDGKLSGSAYSGNMMISLNFDPNKPEEGRTLKISSNGSETSFSKSPGLDKIVWNPNFIIRKLLGVPKMRVSCNPSDIVR